MQPKGKHNCDNTCRAWHAKHKPRGQKPNTIPAGDPRHLSEEMKQRLQNRKK
jgi:hypothetical protein